MPLWKPRQDLQPRHPAHHAVTGIRDSLSLTLPKDGFLGTSIKGRRPLTTPLAKGVPWKRGKSYRPASSCHGKEAAAGVESPVQRELYQ